MLLLGDTLISVARLDDLERSGLGGDWGMQGRRLYLGLMEPADEAQEAPPDDREEDSEPWEEVLQRKRSWVGAKESAWRMSRAARPGGESTQPWKGT